MKDAFDVADPPRIKPVDLPVFFSSRQMAQATAAQGHGAEGAADRDGGVCRELDACMAVLGDLEPKVGRGRLIHRGKTKTEHPKSPLPWYVRYTCEESLVRCGTYGQDRVCMVLSLLGSSGRMHSMRRHSLLRKLTEHRL